MLTMDMAAKPYVDNYPALRDWLRAHDARNDWQSAIGPAARGSSPIAYVERWGFPNGNHCLIVVHADRRGWEIYTPSESSEVAKTQRDAEQRLGLRSAK